MYACIRYLCVFVFYKRRACLFAYVLYQLHSKYFFWLSFRVVQCLLKCPQQLRPGVQRIRTIRTRRVDTIDKRVVSVGLCVCVCVILILFCFMYCNMLLKEENSTAQL